MVIRYNSSPSGRGYIADVVADGVELVVEVHRAPRRTVTLFTWTAETTLNGVTYSGTARTRDAAVAEVVRAALNS